MSHVIHGYKAASARARSSNNASRESNLPRNLRMSDLDEGRDDRGAIDGAARSSGDLPHNDSPTDEIRQNGSKLADRHRLGIILLPSSSWPDGTVFSQRHHQQGLAYGDKEPRKQRLVNLSSEKIFKPCLNKKGGPTCPRPGRKDRRRRRWWNITQPDRTSCTKS